MPGFTESTFVAGLKGPTSMDFAPDGRLFITEKSGSLRVVDHGVLQSTPFLTVPVNTTGEGGLDSVVLDPHFEQNGFVYVYYTRQEGPQVFNRLSRFTADPANPDVALPGSETVLVDHIPSPTPHHDGGSMHFGPDGMLYLGIGDGNTGGVLSQNMFSLNGKILRLNVAAYPNLIAPGNPFANGRRGNPLIWASGFRNPFTSAFDPVSRRFFVNDVGEETWEEIDWILRGQNYGWPQFEGPSPFKATGSVPGMTFPLYSYKHSKVTGKQSAAITGGVFYRAGVFPPFFRGRYFFADFVNGFIRMISPAHPQRAITFDRRALSPVDLDVGPDTLTWARMATFTTCRSSVDWCSGSASGAEHPDEVGCEVRAAHAVQRSMRRRPPRILRCAACAARPLRCTHASDIQKTPPPA
jgi:glucose/arabinose dehydrogenase